MSENFPPRGYLIGAAKSGTTSLAHILDQHPDISLSTPKEPQFFWTHWEKGFDWYRTCFADRDGKVLLDASQSYAMAPKAALDGERDAWPVPARLHAARPDARLIYMVRDPVERAISNYWHARRGGETASLSEAMAAPRNYLCASYYFGQISLYREYFDMDQFLFLSFDDFVADPARVAARCAVFLGVEATASDFSDVRARNQSYAPRPWAGGLLRMMASVPAVKSVVNSIKNGLPERVSTSVRGALTQDIPDTPSALKEQLRAMFAEDAKKFKALTGLSPEK